VLIVRTAFLQEHPETVEALLRAEQKSIDFASGQPDQAKTVTNDAIKQLTNSSLAPAVLDRAFTQLSFGSDPLAATFPQLAKDSVTAGISEKETNLAGFVDVAPLNNVLTAAGKPTVDAAGLDKAQG
jgi:NitT/TauT family transport system substrate-binding protein